MTKNIIRKIFLHHKLEIGHPIEKIKIGYTNKVYTIGDDYILKVCQYVNNEKHFEREVYLYDFFDRQLPVPKVLIYDRTKSLCDFHYMIYPKIKGDTLYSKWHLMTISERKHIIRQICSYLKIIDHSPIESFVNHFKIELPTSWQNFMVSEITTLIHKLIDASIIKMEFGKAIQNFVEKNKSVLKTQEIAIVNWDLHFDNIIVKENKIVGILDFERTDLKSKDYAICLVKRMIQYPTKYVSEESEKYIDPRDYKDLLLWHKEFYPELFKYPNLNKRLELYGLEHDLKTLLYYPEDINLISIVARLVNFES